MTKLPVKPSELPIVDLITATESAIKKYRLPGTQAEQLMLKVSAALSSGKLPPSNISAQEKKALHKDHNITILSMHTGRCTVVLNTAEYPPNLSSLLSDSTV